MSLCLGACEGSGCGEPPKDNKPSSSSAGTSGASSGGGTVSMGDRGESALNAPLKDDSAKPRAGGGEQTQARAPAGAVFAEVDRNTYETKVLKALGAVLVVSYTPRCKGWQDLQAALELLSQDLAGRVAIYRLNVMDPAQAKVLPPGMTPLPVPGLAYYESGQVLAQRQGLPFDRRTGKRGEPIEDPAEYQQRLRLWLRSAVADKDFNLPAPK
ncbi:MAG: hypothetical protein HY926_13325 [Elusimicrobia bacterium]|nr:hypothetical protein [Elusimicrobiota bacterium]